MSTGILGTAFVVIGLVTMFLMFHLWGYPFDKATKTSSAPKLWMLVHRVLGYVFVAIYIVMMVKMVPRLWQYQVEFPARTAIHIVVAFIVGFLLLIKISIMRFFRHFEEWMPFLGTGIMCGTVIITGLSLPFIFQARGTDDAIDVARVAALLPTAGLPKDAPLAELAKTAALESGRDVLLEKCVKCHDLKTILAKPRTPSDWWTVVERMADKPALFSPMTERETWEVTGYLVAITPDLQRATKRKREERRERDAELAKADEEAAAEGDGAGVGSAGNGGAGNGFAGSSDASAGAGSGAVGGNGAGTGSGTAGNGSAGNGFAGNGSDASAGAGSGGSGAAGGNGARIGSAGSGTANGSGTGSVGSAAGGGSGTTGTGTGSAGSSTSVGSNGAKPVPPKPVDLAKAKSIYEAACSQCHDLSDVDAKPPRTAAAVRLLIQRMIKENDALFTADQIKLSTLYMTAHFVNKTF